jgi:hypothetical protein
MDTPMESTVQAWLAKVSCASSSSDEIKRPRGVQHERCQQFTQSVAAALATG